MGVLSRLVRSVVPAGRRAALGRLHAGLTWRFYVGDRHACPLCGGRFRRFLSFRSDGSEGFVDIRPDARCPRCGSLERHRLLWLFLREKTNLFHDRLKVLSVSPEFLFQRVLARLPNLDYWSVDLESPLAFERMDITAMRFGDGEFDVVLCNHVLEHVPDDRRAMEELCRVLKPGGWAIVQTPVDPRLEKTFEDPSVVSPRERARLFRQVDHVRIYGRDYPERLRQAGFTVRLVDYVGGMDPERVLRYGLLEHEDIHYCTRED
jgi:SAM-dependent methyltransferase